MTEEHLIKIDPKKSWITLEMERGRNKKLYVKMTVDIPFEEFHNIANNPFLHTGHNEVEKCSTDKCEGWFATVNGKPTGDQCYNDCGNYYCENCIDKKMDDFGDGEYMIWKICKKCK